MELQMATLARRIGISVIFMMHREQKSIIDAILKLHAKVQALIIQCVRSIRTEFALTSHNQCVIRITQKLYKEYIDRDQNQNMYHILKNRNVSVNFGFGRTISFEALKKTFFTFASRCVSTARASLKIVINRNSQ